MNVSRGQSISPMPVVLSIIGQKGGVGKSTLARAVAVVAVQGSLRVKLIDLDIGQQTLRALVDHAGDEPGTERNRCAGIFVRPTTP